MGNGGIEVGSRELIDFDAIRNGNDLWSVVSRLTGSPRTTSGKICCPFHDERTPSFHVDESKQRWRCYGRCQTGGDVVDFVGRHRHGNAYDPSNYSHISEAVEELCGESVPTTRGILVPKEERKVEHKPIQLIPINNRIPDVTWWHKTMPQDKWDYLMIERGLFPDTIRHFQVGHDGERYTIPVFYRGDLLLVKRRRDDVVLAQQIADGIVPGDDTYHMKKEKYLKATWEIGVDENDNSIREGGTPDFLFNADVLDQGHSTIVVCEGEFDAMIAWQHGFPSISGTAGAGTWRYDWTQRIGFTKNVLVVYDGDEAGQAGYLKIRADMPRAKLVRLPQAGWDLTDLYNRHPRAITWMIENFNVS